MAREALDWLLERRELPLQLRTMHWRMHVGRTLTFRASGGCISFDIVPERGMPQGAPESPAIYACLIEENCILASAALESLDIPAGLPLPRPEDETTPFDVDRLQPRARLHRPAVYSCNFADDTYLLAALATRVSCMVNSFALPLSAAHQFLAADKTAVRGPHGRPGEDVEPRRDAGLHR